MRTLYVDMVGGAAGDMLLAALLDAGAPAGPLQDCVDALGVGAKLLVTKEIRQFLHATSLKVQAPHEHVHRHLPDVLSIIARAKLPSRAAARAQAAFEALARAEGAVHGIEPEKVHFHEVGAVDAIVDVVGVCFALELLGVERVFASPFPVCLGTTQAEHGTLPLPAPAVLELAQQVGAPLEGRPGQRELVTPTAAALLTTLAESFGPYPGMTVEAVGYGAGSRAAPEGAPPNVTRVVLGQGRTAAAPSAVVVLETNLDDQSPEATGYLTDALRAAGALDVFLTPIQMKKGRPGVLLTVIADPASAGLLEDRLLDEASTLGVRRRLEERAVLPREIHTVETPFGAVRVKVAQRPGGSRSCAPEHDDVAERARESGATYQAVYQAALRSWQG